MGKKYYAVKQGLTPGIYTSWDECKANTSGFKGAVFKGFDTEEEARCFLQDSSVCELSFETDENGDIVTGEGVAVAYVDGSFDVASNRFASGLVIFLGGEKIMISHSYNNAEMASMRNVSGEIQASLEAMRYALFSGVRDLTICYDYEGIASWCNGNWKAENEWTKAYKAKYEEYADRMKINFVKVKGHSGDTFNELADYLAKEALGLI